MKILKSFLVLVLIISFHEINAQTGETITVGNMSCNKVPSNFNGLADKKEYESKFKLNSVSGQISREDVFKLTCTCVSSYEVGGLYSASQFANKTLIKVDGDKLTAACKDIKSQMQDNNNPYSSYMTDQKALEKKDEKTTKDKYPSGVSQFHTTKANNIQTEKENAMAKKYETTGDVDNKSNRETSDNKLQEQLGTEITSTNKMERQYKRNSNELNKNTKEKTDANATFNIYKDDPKNTFAATQKTDANGNYSRVTPNKNDSEELKNQKIEWNNQVSALNQANSKFDKSEDKFNNNLDNNIEEIENDKIAEQNKLKRDSNKEIVADAHEDANNAGKDRFKDCMDKKEGNREHCKGEGKKAEDAEWEKHGEAKSLEAQANDSKGGGSGQWEQCENTSVASLQKTECKLPTVKEKIVLFSEEEKGADNFDKNDPESCTAEYGAEFYNTADVSKLLSPEKICGKIQNKYCQTQVDYYNSCKIDSLKIESIDDEKKVLAYCKDQKSNFEKVENAKLYLNKCKNKKEDTDAFKLNEENKLLETQIAKYDGKNCENKEYTETIQADCLKTDERKLKLSQNKHDLDILIAKEKSSAFKCNQAAEDEAVLVLEKAKSNLDDANAVLRLKNWIEEKCSEECHSALNKPENLKTLDDSEIQSMATCMKNYLPTYANEVYSPCRSYHGVASINEYGAYNETKSNGDKKKKSETADQIASFDGTYQCVKKGEYSADFLACKKMVQTYNAAFAGEQAMGVAHQGVQMGTTATNSKKLNKEIEKGQEGDVQDAGLTAARRTARTNRDIEASKIAFFGTKVAVLGGILAEWPTRNSLPKHCESKCADCCDYAAEKLYDGAKSDIFPNAAMKTAFTKEIIMTLGKTAQSALMMAEFNRQANIITDLKKKNKPVADGGGYEILVGLCEADPSDPQCQQGQGNRVDVDNGFNFGVGVSTGGSNNFGSGTDSSEEGLSDLGAYDAVPKGPVTPGAKLGQNDANNARDMLNAPSAASAGLGSPAGGGSGGGGAAGGGGGGGGGAARNPAAANGNSDSSGGNYNYKSGAQYGSGSYGTYVPSNGKGNNLGDMFGNKTAAGGVDEVGRKIASEKVDGKDSNIWLKISGAHKKAVESNRLLHLK